MIPLRVLHVVVDRDGPETQAALALIQALRSQGQTSGLLLPGDGRCSASELTWRRGRLNWWRGGRRVLEQAVVEWMPDLLHVHHPEVLAVALELARDLALPLVANLTGAPDPLAARRHHDEAVAYTLVATEHQRAHAVSRMGLARDRVVVLPPAVQLLDQPLQTQHPTAPWRVGAVAWGKDPLGDGGLRRFFNACAAVQRALPLAVSVLVDAAQATKVAKCSGQAAVEAVVIPGRFLGPWLATVDALVLPGAAEAHPFLPLSAMGHGLPLVASAVGAVPELVRDGQTALLLPTQGDEVLADALRSLHNRTRREGLGLAGHHLAADRYAPGLVAQAADGIYRSAIAGRAGDDPTGEATRMWRRISKDAR